jgi:hypothetical protein
MIFENKECYKVENSGPKHRLERGKNFCRNYRSDRVGGVMKSIYIIENQSQGNNYYQKTHAGCFENSKMGPAIFIGILNIRHT